MPPTKKVSLAELKDKWYKKLAKSGFEDIEDKDHNLKKFHKNFFSSVPKELRTAKASYYQMAENFLGDYRFTDNIEKVIWDYHSNGISVREISMLLKKAKVRSFIPKKSAIWLIIKRLRSSMYSMYLRGDEEYHE